MCERNEFLLSLYRLCTYTGPSGHVLPLKTSGHGSSLLKELQFPTTLTNDSAQNSLCVGCVCVCACALSECASKLFCVCSLGELEMQTPLHHWRTKVGTGGAVRPRCHQGCVTSQMHPPPGLACLPCMPPQHAPRTPQVAHHATWDAHYAPWGAHQPRPWMYATPVPEQVALPLLPIPPYLHTEPTK